MKQILTYLLLSVLSIPVIAEEYACVQYQRKDLTWGEVYKVPYRLVSGEQIQEATSDYYRYTSYNNYAVVEWPNGGYSALELPPYTNELSEYRFERTEDQRGRDYKIKLAPSYGACTKY